MNLVIEFPKTKGKKPPTLAVFKKSCRAVLTDGNSKSRLDLTKTTIEQLYIDLISSQLPVDRTMKCTPKIKRRLAAAEADIKAGRTISLDELAKKYGI